MNLKQTKQMLLPFLAACIGLTTSLSAQAELEFEQATVRLMPAMQKNTAAFVKITNTGQADISLIKASSNISEKTEFHTHLHKDGMAMMHKMDQLIIPAHKSVYLQPGGKHIMLMKLKKDWVKARQVEFELTSKKQKTYRFIAPIEAIKPQSAKVKHNHNH